MVVVSAEETVEDLEVEMAEDLEVEMAEVLEEDVVVLEVVVNF